MGFGRWIISYGLRLGFGSKNAVLAGSIRSIVSIGPEAQSPNRLGGGADVRGSHGRSSCELFGRTP